MKAYPGKDTSDNTQIETFDVWQHEVHSDAGEGYQFQCPMCGDTILWASLSWWNMKCQCGYFWQVEVKAIGQRTIYGESQ